MNAVEVIQGSSPVILGQPHSGTFVPEEIYAQLNDVGRQLLDTDWHIPALYEGLLENATVVRANFSRYVIDANRDPSGVSLYPGKSTTDLVPTTTFDGASIWLNEPDSDCIAQRRRDFHEVYHRSLQAEISRLKEHHNEVLIYDCHSIRSEIPFLFDNELPVLNIGTNLGQTCTQKISQDVEAICRSNNDYSHVINGRFKGGWTTRHYGRPETGVHALQMELAQRAYLKTERPPFEFDEARASALQSLLADVLNSIEMNLQTMSKTGAKPSAV